MAVTISIEDNSDAGSLHFEDDDPLYWHLYPYFETAHRHLGQMVDLYGNAEFREQELLALCSILEDAELDAGFLGDQWEVTVGFRGENRIPINKTITKSDTVKRIGYLKQLLKHAKNIEQPVICCGD